MVHKACSPGQQASLRMQRAVPACPTGFVSACGPKTTQAQLSCQEAY